MSYVEFEDLNHPPQSSLLYARLDEKHQIGYSPLLPKLRVLVLRLLLGQRDPEVPHD